MRDPWDVFWQNQATYRFQAQGQIKVTASCNFSVVEVGLVQHYALYINSQLFILRPEISLILNFCVVGDTLMKFGSGLCFVGGFFFSFAQLVHTS